ncbi:hypothetical protein H1R20_g9538, partial [Candolleomyces eurysporus]
MAPYLESVKSFADVPITDAGVDTAAFLEAADGLVGLFDLFQSAAFAVVQNDIKGNITGVRNRFLTDPEANKTLELLVENERKEGKATATEKLKWLLRGLSFTCKGLQHTQADAEIELSKAFAKSYKETLERFHNFIMKGVFALALNGCPHRAAFYTKLAADSTGGPSVTSERLNEDLNKWLDALSTIVARMESFRQKGRLSKL